MLLNKMYGGSVLAIMNRLKKLLKDNANENVKLIEDMDNIKELKQTQNYNVKDNIIVGNVLEDEMDEEVFGYKAYGIGSNGIPIFNSKEEINDWARSGRFTEKEAELEIEFLEAKNDDEKDKIYKEIIENSKYNYSLSDEEIEELKNGGYKNHYENLDRIYFKQLVDAGHMTEEDLEIEIKLISSKNKEERQEAYNLLVDNLIKKGELTEKQGNKFKSDGYEKHSENMDEVEYYKTVWEMYYLGNITKETAIELGKKNPEDRWDDEFNNLYEKHLLKSDLKAGVITEEEADLSFRLLDAKTEDEKKKIQNELIEYDLKVGRITEKEAKELKDI